MLRLENVATPFTAETERVPASNPPLGFAPRAMEIVPLKLASVFPPSSWAATTTAGEIVLPAVVVLGCTVKARCVAVDAWLTVTPLEAVSRAPPSSVTINVTE